MKSLLSTGLPRLVFKEPLKGDAVLVPCSTIWSNAASFGITHAIKFTAVYSSAVYNIIVYVSAVQCISGSSSVCPLSVASQSRALWSLLYCSSLH